MASTHKSLRSGTANKRPTTSIADGQIALNTNTTSPGLFFKDSTGATIIKVGPVHVGTTAPNASPAAGGSSGNSTGEVWLDTSLTPNGVKIWNGASWTNATPIGSTTVQGLLELATNAETQTGTDPDRAVTPAGLQSKVSDSTSTTSSTTIASSTAVKSAYDLANAALPKSGGTVTGNLEIGTTGSLSFEGATADAFETTIAVVDPTADRTITLPDTTGTVVTTGDTGTVTSTMIADGTIVNGDINASAAIDHSKLANITAGSVLLGNASNVPTATALSGDVTVNSTGVTAISSGVIVNADVNASAAIAGTKISPDFGSQTITTTGVVSAALGAAATPSLTFTGDLNTGIYSPGADQVAISTGGSGRLFVDASGNVGVGASSLSRNFTVRNASTIVAASLVSNPTNIAYLLFGDTDADAQGRVQYNNSTDSLELYSAGSERLRITSAGLVGVGTSSPTAKTEISYSSTAPSLSSNSGAALALAGTSAVQLNFGTNPSSPYNAWIQTRDTGTNSAFPLSINPLGGNVGIGTSSPGTKLHIAEDGDTALTIQSITGSGQSPSIRLQRGTYGTDGFNDVRLYNTSGALLVDNINSVGAATNMLYASTTGVGIGTTSPTHLLTVNGDIRRTGTSNVTVGDTGITAGANYLILGSLGGLNTYLDGGEVYSRSSTATIFNVNSSERARIDSSGRLLVGTSSSIVNGDLLQIASDNTNCLALLSGRNDIYAPRIDICKSRGTTASPTAVANGDQLMNIYVFGYDGSAYRSAASIEAYVDGTPGANDMPGRLVFSTTADGASSPTERMRIASNGNVYIGGGTSFGSGGWTTQNNGEQVNQYSQTSDVRTLYGWSTNNNGTNTSVAYVQSDGKIYARTTTLQAISSERRLKENIIPLNADDAWETVKSVPFYSYNFIGADPSNVLYGPMADEVPDEMRVATSQSDDVGVIHTYDNGMLQARLYVALQAALNKIEALEAKVAALESA